MTLAFERTAWDGETLAIAITGFESETITVDWGDGTSGTTTGDLDTGTAAATHDYTGTGTQTFTITVSDTVTPLAVTLDALAGMGTILGDLAVLPALADRTYTLAGYSTTTASISRDLTLSFEYVELYAAQNATSPTTVDIVGTIRDFGQVTSVSVYRSTATDYTLIYTATSATSATELLLLTDDEAPLGIPITYTLIAVYSTGVTLSASAATQLDGTTGCWLTDVVTGVTIGIELQAWPTRDRTARQSVLLVSGRSDPIVLSDVHTTPAGTWTILTRTAEQRLRVITTLTASRYVRLRTQPSSDITACWAAVGDISEERLTGTGGDTRRLISVAIQEIAPLPATLRLLATLEALSEQADSLAELATLAPTLLDLALLGRTT